MFLTTLLSTTSFRFFISRGLVLNLPTVNSSTFDYNVLKLVETLAFLSMSNLSTLPFKATKAFLAARSDVSMPVACSDSFLLA